MNSLHILIILGFFCSVHGKCRRPEPMKNFELNRYVGTWVYAGVDALNPQEVPTYDKATCGKNHIVLDSTRAVLGKWDIYAVLGDFMSDLRGPFYLPILNRGRFRLYYTNGNFTYDFTVLCTDYTTWAAGYSCADVTPDYASEFVLFFLRDMSVYDDVVSNPEIQSCFSKVTNKTVSQLRKVPYNDCPPEYYT